jgi:hypothetical protein
VGVTCCRGFEVKRAGLPGAELTTNALASESSTPCVHVTWIPKVYSGSICAALQCVLQVLSTNDLFINLFIVISQSYQIGSDNCI